MRGVWRGAINEVARLTDAGSRCIQYLFLSRSDERAGGIPKTTTGNDTATLPIAGPKAERNKANPNKRSVVAHVLCSAFFCSCVLLRGPMRERKLCCNTAQVMTYPWRQFMDLDIQIPPQSSEPLRSSQQGLRTTRSGLVGAKSTDNNAPLRHRRSIRTVPTRYGTTKQHLVVAVLQAEDSRHRCSCKRRGREEGRDSSP